MNAWLIVNPSAGSVDAEPASRALQRLARRGVRVERTGEGGDAQRLAARAADAGADLVIAAGGDGTISEVVNGLAPRLEDVRLAIIPLGTANDFARTLGIPNGDLEAALDALDHGVERRVDLIRGESDDGRSRLIINACTGGFSEIVHGRLTPELKKSWGPLAYLRAAVDAMPDICSHDARLVIDGREERTDACSIVIANGRSAGGLELDPEASIDDGWIDVLCVTAQTFLEEMRLATRYLAGTHLHSDDVVFRRGREVRIDTRPPMSFSSDGELVGRTPLRLTILPRALRVLAPKPPEASESPE